MKIKLADMNHIEKIMTVYAEAREYMTKQGNPEQWGANYPSRELIEQDVRENKCYVVLIDNYVCAVFYFAIENDKAYDVIKQGNWRNNRPYGVVHRIAVGANTHNRGIAGECIKYAVEQCKQAGIYDLRMDTHRDNIPMQQFLEKHDFRKCGIVYVEDGKERIGYHKIIIRNIVFDIGQVLLEFNWRGFIDKMDISADKKEKLTNVTLGNMSHWDQHDRGMSDEEFIEKSMELEPDIRPELEYYMKNIGNIIKEYSYSVPLIKELKAKGYMVYILSNYGKTPFEYARNNMKFIKEVDGMIISSDVGYVKPESEIYEVLFDKFNLIPGECVFLDDRADNIEAAKEMGMSGIVFEDIESAVKQLEYKICQKIQL